MAKLDEIIRIDSGEIAQYFHKASIEGRGTPSDVSDRREPYVRSFIERYFPATFKVAKGSIIDSFGRKSASIDCNLLSASHPYLVDRHNNYSVILADGVDFSIEVKPNIADGEELRRALGQGTSVKALKRRRCGITKLGKKNFNTRWYEDTVFRIPFFIFAESEYKDPEQTIQAFASYYIEKDIPRSQQVDFVVVNGSRVFFNAAEHSYFWHSLERGLYCADFGEDSLGVFLLLLNSLPKSELGIGPSVMGPYLQWEAPEYRFSKDVNRSLKELDIRHGEIDV